MLPDPAGRSSRLDFPVPSRWQQAGPVTPLLNGEASGSELVGQLAPRSLAAVLDACLRVTGAPSAQEAVEVVTDTLAGVLGAEVLFTTDYEVELASPGNGQVEQVASVAVPARWQEALVMAVGDPPRPAAALVLARRHRQRPFHPAEIAVIMAVARHLGRELTRRAPLGGGVPAPSEGGWSGSATPAGPGVVGPDRRLTPAEAFAHELRRRVAALRVTGRAVLVARGHGAGTGRLIDRLVTELDDLDGLARTLLEQRPDGERGADGGSGHLTEVVTAVSEAVATVQSSRGAKIQLEAPDSPQWVRADRVLLRQAVENLVDNAVRYGSSLPVEVVVWPLAGSPEHRAVEVVVLDRGPGFETPASAAHQGSGIGLGLVRRVAERSGGRLWTARRAGGGAGVGICLPAVPAGQAGTEKAG